MTDLANRITEATQARRRLLDYVQRFTPAQAAFKPPAGGWSIAENVEHLVLAEQGSVNRVWTAAEESGAAGPCGKGTRSIAGARSRTSCRRPGCNQPLLEALPDRLRGLDPHPVVTPHPISGPWDAGQWLAFIRFHLDLHRAQIEAVTRATGFPPG